MKLEGFCFTHPVHGDFFRGHPREIAIFLEQVSEAHLFQISNQVIVLLQFKPR